MSPMEPDDPAPSFPVEIERAVSWGEMDAFGHVNNTVYFRYFESARIAYLEAIDFVTGPDRGGLGPILHSTHCRFRRPLVYPDTVRVGARVIGVDDDRFQMEYRIVSERWDETAAEGGGIVVCYDYGGGEKAPLPDQVRRRIEELEDGPPSSA